MKTFHARLARGATALAAAILLVPLAGCPSAKPAPAPAKAAKPSAAPDPIKLSGLPKPVLRDGYRLAAVGPDDVPDAPATGAVHGRRFIVERAILDDAGILELREGAKFFADRSMVLFLFTNEGESLAGRTFQAAPGESLDLHVHMKYVEEGESLPETEMFMDGYAVYLAFDEATEGAPLHGRIYLALPDEKKSWVAGTFEVESE